MIKKILEITSVGRFSNYILRTDKNWDGSFKDVNVIYAPNGSGKTTLSSILKSLTSKKVEPLYLKRTFNCEYPQHIKVLTDKNLLIEFVEGEWTSSLPNIEVLDIFFIEDYLFSGSVLNKKNKSNLFRLLLGEKAEELNIKYSACKTKFKPEKSNKNKVKPLEPEKLRELHDELNKIEIEIDEIIKSDFKNFIITGNKYLRRLAPYIQFNSIQFNSLTDASIKLRVQLVLEVHGEKVLFNAPDIAKRIPTAKSTLSEGDKSAVALAFFLARIELLDYSNKIIVFDDPLSSFDYSRKLSTINILSDIAENCFQFFLLTHDLHFAKEFSEKISTSKRLNLKIENDGLTSLLERHEIDLDALTSLQKDFQIIKTYLKSGSASDFERREIVRCIRPILEGVIRTKYFDSISVEWLGDIISKIKNATPDSRLCKLNKIIDDLIELNDFSKKYHHGNTSAFPDTINPFELKKYIDLLIQTVDQI